MCDDGCTEKAMATKETANREGNGPPNCRREGFNFILVDDPAPSFFFFFPWERIILLETYIIIYFILQHIYFLKQVVITIQLGICSVPSGRYGLYSYCYIVFPRLSKGISGAFFHCLSQQKHTVK